MDQTPKIFGELYFFSSETGQNMKSSLLRFVFQMFLTYNYITLFDSIPDR